MTKGKNFLKLISVLLILTIVMSLSGCIAVDNSSKNSSQNVETEYRHIKNTYHNYINSGDSNNNSNNNSNNDSSDYEEPNDTEFVPDTLNPDKEQEENSGDEENKDELPPEINYDDVLQVPETEIFSESFENYGENGTYIVKYTMNGGDPCDVYVYNDAVAGNYSGRFARKLSSSQWAATYYKFGGDATDYTFQNWKKQKYISFWAKSDGSAQAMLIGIFDGAHESWCKFELTNEWTFYSVKLSDFLHSDFILENVTQIGFTWGGGTQECYVDDIRVTETEVKQYNKYVPVGDPNIVENGELYEGDPLGVKAAYSLFAGDDYSTTSAISLDSAEKKSGDYSIKFTSKPETGKTTAVYTAKLGQNMYVSSFNEVKLNLKGDGTANQKVNAMLYDGNNQVAGATFDISGDWAEYKIPVTIPTNSSNVKFDRIVLATALTSADNVFYLDDFVVANKEGVTETPADVIENGEYYSTSYTVNDAYKTNTALPVTNVSLDNNNKYAGDNSVKFDIPAAGGNNSDVPVANKKYLLSDKQVSVNATGPVTEETFSAPIDFSGTDGNIIVASSGDENTAVNIAYYLWIYTSNKTSNRYYKKYGTTDSNVSITIDELGLSDEDLKSVTGYKMQIWYRGGGSLDYSFSVYANEKIDIVDTNSSILTYDFQTKNLTGDTHFKLQLRGDGKSDTQKVKFELYATSGVLIASEEKEFVSNGEWQEVYLTNNTGIETVAKTLKLTFALTDSSREIWLDDFVSFIPQKPDFDSYPDVIDDFEQYNTFYPPSNYFTFEKSPNYDTAMNVSITDGTDQYGKVHGGNSALKVSSGNFGGASIWYGTAYQSFEDRNIVLNEGDKVSLWVALTQAPVTEFRINIQTENGSTGWQKLNLSDTDWHELEFDISSKATGKITKVWFFMLNSAGAQTTYCVDDIVITRN